MKFPAGGNPAHPVCPLQPSRCVSELCAQAAATFPCSHRHWLLHPRLTRSTISLPACQVPAAPIHLCMSTRPRECIWPHLPSSTWRSKGRGPQQKLVCVVSFFCVFCLSVQELQLPKSALPLIKPCSLHPSLCVAFISCVTWLQAFKNALLFCRSQKNDWSWFFFFFFNLKQT